MGKAKDLAGRRFGRWLVFERAGKDKYGYVTWNCICDCGNKRIVNSQNLIRKRSKSCGCLNRETISKRIGKKSPNWAGDKANYSAVHLWLKKHHPPPAFCERCGVRPPQDLSYNHHKGGKEYERDISKYEYLCSSCHNFKDRGNPEAKPLTKARIHRIREFYRTKAGTQKELARLFKVSRSVVKSIINYKGCYATV